MDPAVEWLESQEHLEAQHAYDDDEMYVQPIYELIDDLRYSAIGTTWRPRQQDTRGLPPEPADYSRGPEYAALDPKVQKWERRQRKRTGRIP